MQHILSSTGSRFHSFKERFSLQRLNWLEYRSLNTWCESLEIIVGDIEFKHSGYVEEGNKCLFTYHEPNHQDYEPDKNYCVVMVTLEAADVKDTMFCITRIGVSNRSYNLI